jgi:ketosteroid isomerase-like protein
MKVTFAFLFAVIALVFIVSPMMLKADDGLEKKVVAKEREELEAIKAGNMKAFADLIADDAVFLNQHGPGTKAQVVEHTSAVRVLDFSMDDVKFVPLSGKSGLVAYKLTEKINNDGMEFTVQVFASAVWAERGGRWVCLFSQETPAKHH